MSSALSQLLNALCTQALIFRFLQYSELYLYRDHILSFLTPPQVAAKDKVWVARRDEIAAHWSKTHPYDAKTAFGQTKQVPC